MKYLICIFLFVYSIPEVFSQTPLEFTFDKDFISLQRKSNTSKDIKVYRGGLSEDKLSNAIPVLGKIIENETTLRFIPIVSFGWDQEYTVVYNNVVDYFKINLPDRYEHLSVEAVYPSASKLPSNLLKWYLEFSKPINQTRIYEHILFTNAHGDTLDKAILSLENALVTDNGRLLTVWIDPGRQKRDLMPNKQLGPVFEEGSKYSLIVQKKLKDREGVLMLNDFSHQFEIIKADRLQPNINVWEIEIPHPNTLSDLIIHCKESMDYGSVLGSVAIQNTRKQKIKGSWQLKDHESILIFTPTHPWDKGKCQLVINTQLEDLAGNNLNRLFDSDINDVSFMHSSIKERILEFVIE